MSVLESPTRSWTEVTKRRSGRVASTDVDPFVESVHAVAPDIGGIIQALVAIGFNPPPATRSHTAWNGISSLGLDLAAWLSMRRSHDVPAASRISLDEQPDGSIVLSFDVSQANGGSIDWDVELERLNHLDDLDSDSNAAGRVVHENEHAGPRSRNDSRPAAVSTGPLASDASVAQIASRVAQLSGLSDERLAELFKVERETFCRWRTGVLTNPRAASRRRLGLLLILLEDLNMRRVNIKDWLLNPVAGRTLTPYDLVSKGRIDEVAFLAASVGEQPTERDVAMTARTAVDSLTFGDDNVWEFSESDEDEP